MKFETESSLETYNFFLLLGVFDKPARTEMLQMALSTGYFGCLKCIQEGKWLSYGRGGHMTYSYEERITLRDKVNYAAHLASRTHGVLDECVLSKYKYYHPTESTNIDLQ